MPLDDAYKQENLLGATVAPTASAMARRARPVDETAMIPASGQSVRSVMSLLLLNDVTEILLRASFLLQRNGLAKSEHASV